MGEIKRGDHVRLRAFGGEQIVRRVVSVEDGVLLVCRDETFDAAQRAGQEPIAVGFPLDSLLEVMGENGQRGSHPGEA